MELTKEQIQNLYKFTRQHFVVHYDVQTELVDHLANDIEQKWLENSKLTFKEARDLSFKKFGVFGFMEVVEQKQKAMHKRYWKILWRFAKQWFSLPKIIITGIVFMVFYTVFQIQYAEEVILVTLSSLLLLDFYFLFKIRHFRKRKKQQKEKIYLLESMIGDTRNGLSAMMIVNIFNLINLSDIKFVELAIYWQLLLAFVSTLICIVFYISTYIMPLKAEELLKETYPEYKML